MKAISLTIQKDLQCQLNENKQDPSCYSMMKHIKSNSVFKERISRIKSELESKFIQNIKFRKAIKKLEQEVCTLENPKCKHHTSSYSRKPSVSSIYLNQPVTIDSRKSQRKICINNTVNLLPQSDRKKSFASIISKKTLSNNFEQLAYGSSCLKISPSKRTSIFLRTIRSKQKMSNAC